MRCLREQGARLGMSACGVVGAYGMWYTAATWLELSRFESLSRSRSSSPACRIAADPSAPTVGQQFWPGVPHHPNEACLLLSERYAPRPQFSPLSAHVFARSNPTHAPCPTFHQPVELSGD